MKKVKMKILAKQWYSYGARKDYVLPHLLRSCILNLRTISAVVEKLFEVRFC